MRLSLWLVLILAFSVGMGCALVIRTLHFEAKPVVTQTPEPTTKILIATRTIPSGVEITADFVAFHDVPRSEVPIMALTDFTQVYRRQTAYPIPADCPICEDLLLPRSEGASQAAFIPTGGQFVTFDIEHIRLGDRVFSPTQPLSTVLAAEQRVDIWVIPQVETQGRFAEMKNEVLRTHAAHNLRNTGELLLESVPIHQIQRRSFADQSGSVKDSLVVLLDKNDETRLTAAAKKGQIRIFLRPNEEPAPLAEVKTTTVETASVETAIAEQPQDILLEVPAVLEQLPVPRMLTSTSSPEKVASIIHAPVPMSADPFDAELPPAPVPVPTPDSTHLPVVRELRNLEPPENSLAANSPPEELTSIRNDAPSNSFIGVPRRVSPGERSVVQQPDSVPALGMPRVTHALQFVSPEQVASPQELPKRQEVPTPPSAPPPTVPMPPPLKEKQNMPEYSPFEQRRVYTVQPSTHSEESSEELQISPQLWRSPNAAAQSK